MVLMPVVVTSNRALALSQLKFHVEKKITLSHKRTMDENCHHRNNRLIRINKQPNIQAASSSLSQGAFTPFVSLLCCGVVLL